MLSINMPSVPSSQLVLFSSTKTKRAINEKKTFSAMKTETKTKYVAIETETKQK